MKVNRSFARGLWCGTAGYSLMAISRFLGLLEPRSGWPALLDTLVLATFLGLMFLFVLDFIKAKRKKE